MPVLAPERPPQVAQQEKPAQPKVPERQPRQPVGPAEQDALNTVAQRGTAGPDTIFGRLARRLGFSRPSADAAAQPPAVDMQKSPEAVRDSIAQDVGRLADIQLRIATAKDALQAKNPQLLNDEARLAQVKAEAEEGDKNELAQSLMSRMESARAELGDFCVVVGEGDKKGIVFLSPREKTVRQGVASRISDDVVYNKQEDVQEVYFLNGHGLQKMTVSVARRFSIPEDSKYKGESWVQESIDASSQNMKDYGNDASSALDAVIDGKTDPGRGDRAKAIADNARAVITGQKESSVLTDDREAPLNIAVGADILQNTIPSQMVTVDVDAKDAFADSVAQAAKKRELIAKEPGSWSAQHSYLYAGPNRQ